MRHFPCAWHWDRILLARARGGPQELTGSASDSENSDQSESHFVACKGRLTRGIQGAHLKSS